MPEVFLSGNAGRIEARYTPGEADKIALVLHPHPLYGGSMHNKVVYNVAKALSAAGYSVLRPNFRGVGRSEGAYDNAEGELYDAVDSFDWIQARHPGFSSCVVAGFSFGAYIAIQILMRRPEVNWFIALAPPVSNFDMSFISPCPAPGLVFQGSADTIVSAPKVEEFVKKLRNRSEFRVDYHLFDKCDHFFGGHLETVNKKITEFAQEQIAHGPSRVHQDPHTAPDDSNDDESDD